MLKALQQIVQYSCLVLCNHIAPEIAHHVILYTRKRSIDVRPTTVYDGHILYTLPAIPTLSRLHILLQIKGLKRHHILLHVCMRRYPEDTVFTVFLLTLMTEHTHLQRPNYTKSLWVRWQIGQLAQCGANDLTDLDLSGCSELRNLRQTAALLISHGKALQRRMLQCLRNEITPPAA